MKISSRSGFVAFAWGAVVTATLLTAFVYLLSLPWANILAGKPMEFLPLSLPILIALAVVFRALDFRQHEWTIGDNHLRIRTWKKRDTLIAAEQIDSIDREQEVRGGDRDNGLPYVRFVVTLKDGETFASPFMTDDAQISRAWRKLEALMQSGG